MDLDLKGKTALVTGASKGIGAAIAMGLAAEGCSVRLIARDADALAALGGDIRARYGCRPETIAADLRDPSQRARLAAHAADVDVLVNNAGDIPAGTLDNVDDATWRHAWELKVFAYIELCRVASRHMRSRGRGVILNVIGMAGERLCHDYIAGSTGNAALIAFTRALGSTSLGDGVRVVGINPGLVLTERIVTLYKQLAMARWGDEQRYSELLADQPAGALVDPADVADLVLFLASDRARRISGSVVAVDGGRGSFHALGGR